MHKVFKDVDMTYTKECVYCKSKKEIKEWNNIFDNLK